MWVATTDFPTAASHPFYADTMGRPGLPPGIHFRLLLIGYFEGIDSERGIAWRAADSFALRDFLGVGLEDAPPDHSTFNSRRVTLHQLSWPTNAGVERA